MSRIDDFISHYTNVTPWTQPRHSWLSELWQQKFNCSFGGVNDCVQFPSLVEGANDTLSPWLYSKDVDGMYVYATALHNLISARCPNAFITRHIPTNCITGPSVFEHMKNVSIDGYSEDKISFDEKGDIMGSYTIYQLLYVRGDKTRDKVGSWSRLNRLVNLRGRIIWPKDSRSTTASSQAPSPGVVTGVPHVSTLCMVTCHAAGNASRAVTTRSLTSRHAYSVRSSRGLMTAWALSVCLYSLNTWR